MPGGRGTKKKGTYGVKKAKGRLTQTNTVGGGESKRGASRWDMREKLMSRIQKGEKRKRLFKRGNIWGGGGVKKRTKKKANKEVDGGATNKIGGNGDET